MVKTSRWLVKKAPHSLWPIVWWWTSRKKSLMIAGPGPCTSFFNGHNSITVMLHQSDQFNSLVTHNPHSLKVKKPMFSSVMAGKKHIYYETIQKEDQLQIVPIPNLHSSYTSKFQGFFHGFSYGKPSSGSVIIQVADFRAELQRSVRKSDEAGVKKRGRASKNPMGNMGNLGFTWFKYLEMVIFHGYIMG